jgi:hypothetical protein
MLFARFIAPFIALFITLWGGCSSPVEIDNPEQILLIQAFLTPGEEVVVNVQKTLPSRLYYEGLEDPVSGAQVIVNTEASTTVLDEDPAVAGIYKASAQALPVIEGETYQLEVTHEDRVVRARTTVPIRSRVTEVVNDTITYFQRYGDIFGELVHPGEFSWIKSPTAAGYVIIVEALDVTSLPVTAEPLTAQFDTLLALRERLEGQVANDSLRVLERQISDLRAYFNTNITLVNDAGDTTRFLRERQQEDWREQEAKESTNNWTEGKLWRERRQDLFGNRVLDFWVPADSTRSDFWWLGVRFEGEYRITLQSVDENYFDYYTTLFNGNSGADSDPGPIFHVDGGTGVFGSYSRDSFRVIARRGD